MEEAKLNAREAIELYMESLKEHGEEIPSDDELPHDIILRSSHKLFQFSRQ
jgi:predicted RNase H-like HicB family nuclease